MSGGTKMMYIKAFLVGGVICAISQVLIDRTRLTPARILTSYVVLGVILSAVGVYEPLVKWAGCGATVPIIGFGYTMAKGVKSAVAEQGLLGALSGGITACAAGLALAVTLSLIAALMFRSSDRG
jgi:stage V sporulation protein AE